MLIFNNFPLGQEEQLLKFNAVLKSFCTYSVNLLQPTGYVMHQQV